MADDIEVALYTLLQTKTGLTALVSTRIHSNRADSGQTCPYIIYQRISGDRERILTGPLGGCRTSYQFDIFGTSKASVEAVRKQLRLALDGYTGTSSSVEIYNIRLENDFDGFEDAVNQYRATLIFEVTFLEDIT